MGIRVIYVMTHDSIGVGEDGPTHQPVEQIASLRAIPNLYVFRPADAIETAECWELSIERTLGPSLHALTRQSLPPVRKSADKNMCARGGYVLRTGKRSDDLVLLATGSEVHLAVKAHEELLSQGISARVVSIPCMDLFLDQDDIYIHSVIGKGLPKIAIEAGIRQGWDRLMSLDDRFVGMDGFGASGPAPQLFKHFGITVEAILAFALDLME